MAVAAQVAERVHGRALEAAVARRRAARLVRAAREVLVACDKGTNHLTLPRTGRHCPTLAH